MRLVERHSAYDNQAEELRKKRGITREQEHEELVRDRPEFMRRYDQKHPLLRAHAGGLPPSEVEKLNNLERQQHQEWRRQVES